MDSKRKYVLVHLALTHALDLMEEVLLIKLSQSQKEQNWGSTMGKGLLPSVSNFAQLGNWAASRYQVQILEKDR